MTQTTKRILMLGASGTAGKATAAALGAAGHQLFCLGRSDSGTGHFVPCRTLDRATLEHAMATHGPIDCLISCLASRTGLPADAWSVDYQVHHDLLQVAQAHGVGQMVMLSAICVQRPQLEFQRAKLAFETELIASGLTYSIVRPTAFFKSLSGQIERLRAHRDARNKPEVEAALQGLRDAVENGTNVMPPSIR